MYFWNLSPTSISALRALPETGMGFQWVLARSGGQPVRLLVLNAQYAFDVSHVQLLPGDDPPTIATNGLRVFRALREPRSTAVARPEPTGYLLLANRIEMAAAPTAAVVPSTPQIVQSSGLVKKVKLGGRRIFHRFSAFNPDRRIEPQTGNFPPGTCCVPDSELPLLPSGLAAVARLALPALEPASHHYFIEAPADTVVRIGSVAPGFGQAGGGVEAFFPEAVVNTFNPKRSPARLPDE